MSEREPCVVYFDGDRTGSWSDNFRKLHVPAVRERGFAFVSVGLSGRGNPGGLEEMSDAVYYIERCDRPCVESILEQIELKYEVRGMFAYTGQVTPEGEAGVVISQVAKARGLRQASAASVEACNNKFIMRQVLKEAGLSKIRFGVASTIEELRQEAAKVGFPLIAKPLFGGGSAFVALCQGMEQLEEHFLGMAGAFDQASARPFLGNERTYIDHFNETRTCIPGRTLLLEQFIPGSEGTVECIAASTRSFALAVQEKLKLTFRKGTVLEDLLVSPPSPSMRAHEETIRRYTEDCLDAIGLTHSLAHFEFRLHEGEVEVIEINPRVGGLTVKDAYRLVGGIDPFGAYFDILLDAPGVTQRLLEARRFAASTEQMYSMMVVYPRKSGVIRCIEGEQWLQANPRFEQFRINRKVSVVDAENEENFLAFCWVPVDGKEDAQALYADFTEHVVPQYEIPDAISSSAVLRAGEYDAFVKRNAAAQVEEVRSQGYAHLEPARYLEGVAEEEIRSFRATWDNLDRDPRFQDYTLRFRSSSRYELAGEELVMRKDQGFRPRVQYDRVEYKEGDLEKSFVLPAASAQFKEHPLFSRIVGFDLSMAKALGFLEDAKEIDVHQFRVRSRGCTPSPTTSGIHQDGCRLVFMHFIGVQNSDAVVSSLYTGTEADACCFSREMTEFGECLVVDDQRIFHEAGPVAQIEDGPAFRDLLLVTIA